MLMCNLYFSQLDPDSLSFWAMHIPYMHYFTISSHLALIYIQDISQHTAARTPYTHRATFRVHQSLL